jgi:hypothetical protein
MLWKTDDPNWRRHRAELWKATGDCHRRGVPGLARSVVKDHFFTGVLTNVEGRELWPGHREVLWDWNSNQGARVRLRMLPAVEPELAKNLAHQMARGPDTVNAVLMLMCASEYGGAKVGEGWSSSFGMMDGLERDLVRLFLPEHFEHDAWRAEYEARFVSGRRFLSPREAFDLMVDCGYGFLTHYAANPQHPIQDFIPYWREAMGHYRVETEDQVVQGYNWVKRLGTDAAEAARVLCETVQHFREPRGLPGTDTPAARFRDDLKARLDEGLDCPVLDAAWAAARGPRREALMRLHDNDLVDRVLFGELHDPDTLRRVVDQVHEMGGCDAFDPSRLTPCDLKSLLHEDLAAALGMRAGASVRALHYAAPLSPSFLVSSPDEVEVTLELFWLLTPAGSTPTAATPRLIASLGTRWTDQYRFPVLDDLLLRSAFWTLAERHGICFVRVDTLDQRAVWPKAPAICTVGVERFMAITTGSVLEIPYDPDRRAPDGRRENTPADHAKPWRGGVADAALAAFRASLA